MTTVHQRHDVRIFLKECRSIAQRGYKTYLIVADGKGDELYDGVQIIDAGASNSRWDRMRNGSKRVLNVAISLDVQTYHFHDPELIPVGLKLKRLGKRVFFDAHEDLPKQLLSKPYLNKLTGSLLSKFFAIYENHTCQKFDGIITATPSIREKFLKINPNTLDINNYPLPEELGNTDIDWSQKRKQVCYVGGITAIRGIKQVLGALALLESEMEFQLVGPFSEGGLKERMQQEPGWTRTNYLGTLKRSEVANVLAKSVAGIVTFLPAPNHVDAQPNKMFEYMSAGIPVIASNFPIWRQIIDANHCGICVDPGDPKAIAAAIDYLATHPEEAEVMGRNGQRAVQDFYNWSKEAEKLLNFYL